MSKVELAGLDGLIERMKDQCLEWHEWEPEEDWSLYQRDFQDAVAKIEALRDCARELAWYGEQARLCRLVHSGGDDARASLSKDGGKRADEALARFREVGEG